MQEVYQSNCKLNLNNQHRITITEEAVFIFNGLFISVHNKIVAGESACHNLQACLRQMKICDKRICNIKCIWRMDKMVRPAL